MHYSMFKYNFRSEIQTWGMSMSPAQGKLHVAVPADSRYSMASTTFLGNQIYSYAQNLMVCMTPNGGQVELYGAVAVVLEGNGLYFIL